MTAPAPTPPTPEEALQALLDALEGNELADKPPAFLQRALAVDQVGAVLRPRATAARLIEENTDYEVTGELRARIDRKIASLKRTQRQHDALFGVVPTGGMSISWGDR